MERTEYLSTQPKSLCNSVFFQYGFLCNLHAAPECVSSLILKYKFCVCMYACFVHFNGAMPFIRWLRHSIGIYLSSSATSPKTDPFYSGGTIRSEDHPRLLTRIIHVHYRAGATAAGYSRICVFVKHREGKRGIGILVRAECATAAIPTRAAVGRLFFLTENMPIFLRGGLAAVYMQVPLYNCITLEWFNDGRAAKLPSK